MNIFKKLFSFILVFPLLTMAQSSNKYIEKEKMLNFFHEKMPWKTTKDSTAIYAFSFKVFVEKNLQGDVKVISLTASDSIAYQIYPNYKFLKTLKYEVFMERARAATFIIPVGIEVIASKGNKVPTSDFLTNVMSLFNFKPFDNTEPEIFIYFKPYLLRLNKEVID